MSARLGISDARRLATLFSLWPRRFPLLPGSALLFSRSLFPLSRSASLFGTSASAQIIRTNRFSASGLVKKLLFFKILLTAKLLLGPAPDLAALPGKQVFADLRILAKLLNGLFDNSLANKFASH